MLPRQRVKAVIHTIASLHFLQDCSRRYLASRLPQLHGTRIDSTAFLSCLTRCGWRLLSAKGKERPMNSQRRAFLAVIDDRSTYYCQRKASVINPRRVAFRAAKKKGHAEITQDAPESHSQEDKLCHYCGGFSSRFGGSAGCFFSSGTRAAGCGRCCSGAARCASAGGAEVCCGCERSPGGGVSGR